MTTEWRQQEPSHTDWRDLKSLTEGSPSAPQQADLLSLMTPMTVSVKHQVYSYVDLCTLYPVARVSLVPRFYTVEENNRFVEVCTEVTSPSIDSPVDFNFNIQLTTADNTASGYSF